MNNEQLAISNQQLARNNKGNILVVDDTPANLRLLRSSQNWHWRCHRTWPRNWRVNADDANRYPHFTGK
jgi:hypothetical protein